MSFLDQPAIYPTDPGSQARQELSALISTAQNATSHDDSLRVLLIGDSTSTESGGAGVHWVPLFRSVLGQVCGGNVAGSGLVSLRDTQTLANVRTSSNGSTNGVFGDNYFPPGVNFSTLLSDSLGDTSSPYLLRDGDPTFLGSARRLLAGTLSGMFPLQSSLIEAYAIKRANSSENMLIRHKPTASFVNVFESVESSQTISFPGLNQSTSSVELVKSVSAQFDATTSKPYSQFQLHTADPVVDGSNEAVDLACVRLLNPNPKGAMLDSFSAGGYRSENWFGVASDGSGNANHVNCAGTVAQLGHDVIVIMMGANDHFGDVSSDQQRDNIFNTDPSFDNKGLLGEILAERESRGLPKPLVVLASTMYRCRGSINGVEENLTTYNERLSVQQEHAASNMILADRLQATGVSTIAFNLSRHTYLAGFNEIVDDHFLLTNRGVYDVGGVDYTVGDSYIASDNLLWQCVRDHTSSAARAPLANGTGRYHLPAGVNLSDFVHFTVEGAKKVANGFNWFFAQHAGGGSSADPNTQLSEILHFARVAASNNQ